MSETTSHSISSLQDALNAEEFPDVDLALRRGRHIDRDDTAWYGFLVDAQSVLEEFYGRFGCDLVQRTDGYFFLLPTGDRLRKKHLSTGAMLVGQALALLYLDPATAGLGGLVSKDQLLAQLDGVVGTDALIRSFNPKRRRYDERVAQETVRKKVAVEVRRLAGLGFVELAPNEQIRLRPALLRFAEPVRGLADPAEALAKLVASGEIELTEEPTIDLDETRAEEHEEVVLEASTSDVEEPKSESSFANSEEEDPVADSDEIWGEDD
jgi:chromosome partition protein MukE